MACPVPGSGVPAVPAAGCASDGAAPWPVDGETTSVTLRMSVAGAVGTRADGTEDEYATLENRINTLRVPGGDGR